MYLYEVQEVELELTRAKAEGREPNFKGLSKEAVASKGFSPKDLARLLEEKKANEAANAEAAKLAKAQSEDKEVK